MHIRIGRLSAISAAIFLLLVIKNLIIHNSFRTGLYTVLTVASVVVLYICMFIDFRDGKKIAINFIKFLKGICVVFGFICFIGIFAAALLFSAGTLSYSAGWIMGIMSFIFLLICSLGYLILEDHENAQTNY